MKDFRNAQKEGGKNLKDKLIKSNSQNKSMVVISQFSSPIQNSQETKIGKNTPTEEEEEDWDGVVTNRKETKKVIFFFCFVLFF